MRTHLKTIVGIYPWHCHRSVLRFQYFDTQSGEWRRKRKDNIPKYVAQDVSKSYKNVLEGRDAVLMIGKKIEDYLQFFTHAGETRFPIFAWESLPKLSHFVIFMWLMLTLTLKIV